MIDSLRKVAGFSLHEKRSRRPVVRGASNCLASAETLKMLPELRPAKAGSATDQDVLMVAALFVADAERVGAVHGKAATDEHPVGIVMRDADDDQGGGRRGGIAAQPCRVGAADRRWQLVGGTENFDRTLLAVIADEDADAGVLIRRQSVADRGEVLIEFVPAELFT